MSAAQLCTRLMGYKGLTLIRVFRKHLILHGWNCGSAIALLRPPTKRKGEYE